MIVLAWMLLFSTLYTDYATTLLSEWLTSQQPIPQIIHAPQAVLLGRGAEIANATTTLAARLMVRGEIKSIYVSGDSPSTAERLISLGVSPERLAGDSCARTTWENAIRTTAWLKNQPAEAAGSERKLSVTLITDRWQMPRASRAFQRQGVTVVPVVPSLNLSPQEQNRLALRETAAILLYQLLGRT